MSIVSTKVWTWARALLDNMLGALTTRPAGALLTTPTVELITDSNPISPDDAVSNHTIANFSGYVHQTLTLAGPGNVGTHGTAMFGSVAFVATAASPFVTNQVTGYLLTDGATAFYGGEEFATPIAIAGPGDFIDLTLLLLTEFVEQAT